MLAPQKAVSKSTFKRTETKFLAPREKLETILKYCHEFSKPNYPNSNTIYTLIESLYFDSDEVDFFKNHFAKLNVRYKVRVRKYGPNGVWNHGIPLLEIKKKENGMGFKDRFLIDPFTYEALGAGKSITEQMKKDLLTLNPEISPSALEKTIETLNWLIEVYKIHPTSKVSYKRFAFEKDDFRLTIDTDISHTSLTQAKNSLENILASETRGLATKMLSSYKKESHLVMELKHLGEIPLWCRTMLEELSLNETSFSKYCWAMATSLTQGQDYASA